MELFGGLMVLLWMVGFFLTVIWFILPFVIFSIKARVEETLHRVDSVDARLATIEKLLAAPLVADSQLNTPQQPFP